MGRRRDGRAIGEARRRRCRLVAAVLGAAMPVVPAAVAQVTPHSSPAADPAPGANPVAWPLEPLPVGDGVTLRPIVDLRIRYETVDQQGFARDAQAVTGRLRAGVEAATRSGFAALLEAEGVLPIDPDYNSGANRRTNFPGVADPAAVEINRAQLRYRSVAAGLAITAGRQLIAIDDQRFVGASAWRQNEQTFDAVRVEARRLGPFVADAVYAWSDRKAYPVTTDRPGSAPSYRAAIGGDNVFAGLGATVGRFAAKGFAYLVDQDAAGRRQFSSQTYGARASADLPAGPLRLTLVASYARQSAWASNPGRYTASYWTAEGGATLGGFGAILGYEVLGADGGAAGTSFQTPLATLHRFNGYADQFLVTPANGLGDGYVSLGRDFAGTGALPGLTASLAWHRFRSDRLDLHYGDEWDAQIGIRRHGVGVLAKYARYDADRFGVDVRKFWLELDWTI